MLYLYSFSDTKLYPTWWQPQQHLPKHVVDVDKLYTPDDIVVLWLSYPYRIITLGFDVLLTVHLSIFISVINQLDAQNFCFTVSLFHASTCFEHMCSKHVEAWNKLIVKQQFCASSWLITEINITLGVTWSCFLNSNLGKGFSPSGFRLCAPLVQTTC